MVFTGTYTATNPNGGELNFGAYTGQGTYTLTPTANFTNFNTGLGPGQEGRSFSFDGTVLNIETSKFDGNQTLGFGLATSGNLVNIVGAQNIALSIYSGMKYDTSPSTPDDGSGVTDAGEMIFNQSTADDSTWSGGVDMNGENVTLEAVTGGRLNYNSVLYHASPHGITVNAQAGGVVVISGNSSYYLADGNNVDHGYTTVASLEGGTTLITNGTSGNTPFGSSAGNINVSAGATFGGNGATGGSQLTKMLASTAVLAPGDPGQSNLNINPSIGTLDLQGGLEADNGLTMDFKLTGEGLTAGTSNDFLEVSSFTLGSGKTVTVNLTALDALETGAGNDYVLFSDSNSDFDSATAANFDVIAPTGYALDPTYDGNGGNGGYDYTDGVLRVQLVATPEPSTYGLIGFGLLALVAIGRFRKLAA
jgi:hypothetical protein